MEEHYAKNTLHTHSERTNPIQTEFSNQLFISHHHTRLFGTEDIEGHNPSTGSQLLRLSLLQPLPPCSAGKVVRRAADRFHTSLCYQSVFLHHNSSHAPTHTHLCSLVVIGRLHTDADTQPIELVQLLVRHGPKHRRRRRRSPCSIFIF